MFNNHDIVIIDKKSVGRIVGEGIGYMTVETRNWIDMIETSGLQKTDYSMNTAEGRAWYYDNRDDLNPYYIIQI